MLSPLLPLSERSLNLTSIQRHTHFNLYIAQAFSRYFVVNCYWLTILHCCAVCPLERGGLSAIKAQLELEGNTNLGDSGNGFIKLSIPIIGGQIIEVLLY